MNTDGRKDRSIIFVTFLSVVYNAVLSIINAHVMPLGFSHVALAEISILLMALLYILWRGLHEEDLPVLGFLLFTLMIAGYMSVLNRSPYIDYFRNILIVFCFATLGTWANRATVTSVFHLSLLAVMAVLVCEMVSLPFYAGIFEPGYYFETTRGLKSPEWDTSGLFGNALGFKGRLSFGLIGHRASSLFLEQVSLSNFAGVMMMYTLFFWEGMKRSARFVLSACILLMLLTTASRTMLTFAAVCIAGYVVFPRIPKLVSLLTMPLILFAATVIYIARPDATGDNLSGRIVLTMRYVFDMDIFGMLGLYAAKASFFADSGYVYIVYGGTIFGLIAFWLFVSLFPAGETAAQRRLAHALPIFLFFNLMIGATPVFTAKIAGLLWLLVGHARQQMAPRRRNLPGPARAPISTAVQRESYR